MFLCFRVKIEILFKFINQLQHIMYSIISSWGRIFFRPYTGVGMKLYRTAWFCAQRRPGCRSLQPVVRKAEVLLWWRNIHHAVQREIRDSAPCQSRLQRWMRRARSGARAHLMSVFLPKIMLVVIKKTFLEEECVACVYDGVALPLDASVDSLFRDFITVGQTSCSGS